jgi:hypothetical protein
MVFFQGNQLYGMEEGVVPTCETFQVCCRYETDVNEVGKLEFQPG